MTRPTNRSHSLRLSRFPDGLVIRWEVRHSGIVQQWSWGFPWCACTPIQKLYVEVPDGLPSLP